MQQSADINPLITPPDDIPYGAPPYNLIRNEHFLPAVEWAIQRAQEAVDAIKQDERFPDFENSVAALEFADRDLRRVAGILYALSQNMSTQELQAVDEQVTEKIKGFYAGILQDDTLFSRIKAVHDAKGNLPLNEEQKTLREKLYRDFINNGVNLEPSARARFAEIEAEISKKVLAHTANVLNSKKHYKTLVEDESLLEGVPEDAKHTYQEYAQTAGLGPKKWLIPISPPPDGIMEYAKNRKLREEVMRASTCPGSEREFDNTQIVIDILKLRKERALLLGKAGHAEVVLETQMQKTPEAVLKMLHEDTAVYGPAYRDFIQKLKDLAFEQDGITDFKVSDFAYYSRLHREREFNVSVEDTRDYFEFESVIEGIFRHTQDQLGIEIRQAKPDTYPLYSDDVRVYELIDKGAVAGLMYADFYERPGQKEGIQLIVTRARSTYDGATEIPVFTFCVDFAKAGTQPSLLSMREVTTLAHELGHGLQAGLSKGDYPTTSSIEAVNPALPKAAMPVDYSELASTVQEYWMKEPSVLTRFASHYETGAPLDEQLVNKIRDMDKSRQLALTVRTLFHALLDMEVHMMDPDKLTRQSLEKMEDELIERLGMPPRLDKSGVTINKLMHLFIHGYDCGYHAYQKSHHLAAAIFEPFQNSPRGLYDPALGRRLLQTIYQTGGTRDCAENVRDMLGGRDPDPQALFRLQGIVPSAQAGTSSSDIAAEAPQPGQN